MIIGQFKEVNLCDEVLRKLTTDERADLMAYIGNGLMTHLLKPTPYYYARSTPRYYPVDGMMMMIFNKTINYDTD